MNYFTDDYIVWIKYKYLLYIVDGTEAHLAHIKNKCIAYYYAIHLYSV